MTTEELDRLEALAKAGSTCSADVLLELVKDVRSAKLELELNLAEYDVELALRKAADELEFLLREYRSVKKP